MIESQDQKLGRVAYDAYCQERDWKSFNGDPLPSFAEMTVKSPQIAAAWVTAAKAVAQEIAVTTGRG